MKNKQRILSSLVLLALLGGSGSSLVYAHSNKFDQDTICHKKADGSFEKIITSPHTLAPHFNPDGSPKAGHEQDLLFEGDHDCPTGGGGGGDGGGGGGGGGSDVCIKPTALTNVVVDTQVLNDHKLMITWQGGTGADSISIKYGWDENNLNQSVSSPNDGVQEIINLTNGLHYWFQLQAIKAGCPGDLSEKIDPLP